MPTGRLPPVNTDSTSAQPERCKITFLSSMRLHEQRSVAQSAHLFLCICRLKEQQLKEAQESAAVIDKGRATAERATDSAWQTKQRMESELARLQRLVTELEQSKR